MSDASKGEEKYADDAREKAEKEDEPTQACQDRRGNSKRERCVVGGERLFDQSRRSFLRRKLRVEEGTVEGAAGWVLERASNVLSMYNGVSMSWYTLLP